MALPAGLPPASFRLEDGCLMCSATAAIECGMRNEMANVCILWISHSSTRKNGQRGRTCTCDRSVPGRVCWLLHYALCPQQAGGAAPEIWFIVETGRSVPWNDARRKIGGCESRVLRD